MKEKKEGHSKTVQAKTKVNPLILQLPGAVALFGTPETPKSKTQHHDSQKVIACK